MVLVVSRSGILDSRGGGILNFKSWYPSLIMRKNIYFNSAWRAYIWNGLNVI